VTDSAVARIFDRTHIDYLRVTTDEHVRVLRRALRGPIEIKANGLPHYSIVERDGYGTVLASGGPEGGRVMLQMSGEPLACWRAEKTERELVELLALPGIRCTRIDIARDTAGEWTPYRLREFLEAERYVSTWRRRPLYTHEQGGGLTVQMGARESDIMLRVYDKRAELLDAGKACDQDPFSRWELEVKGPLAKEAFGRVVALAWDRSEDDPASMALGMLHAAWLSERLRLTVEPVHREAKEQSRSKTDASWTEFLLPADGSTLCSGGDARTRAEQAAEFAAWFLTNCAASLVTFLEMAGRDELESIIGVGQKRLSAKHRMLVDHAAETGPAVAEVLTRFVS
jgi:hypothetical protein